MQMHIRAFEEGDLGGLRTCVVALQAAERALSERISEPQAVADTQLAAMIDHYPGAGAAILVAEVGGAIAGYVTIDARVRSEQPREVPYCFAEIEDLAVIDAYRGKGVGKALLGAAEQHARKHGAGWLRISVMAESRLARSLYERSGFAEHMVSFEKTLCTDEPHR